MLDLGERRAVEAAVRRFVARVDETLFPSAEPDGELPRIPQLLAEARAMGLLAEPKIGAPGYELGVWGRACHDEGPMRSLLTLAILGEACAGFATAIHAAGLACLALARSDQRSTASPPTPAVPLAAVFTPNYGVPLSARRGWVGTGLTLTGEGAALQLNGSSHFALAAEPPGALICFAQRGKGDGGEREWAAVLVGVDAPGVAFTEVAPRTGLRAVCQFDLQCAGVSVTRESLVAQGEAARSALVRLLACDWLGHAAIALGAARRALRDSRAFTAERYQGGKLIEDHAAIQLLQGTAAYDIAMQAAILFRDAGMPLRDRDAAELLNWALTSRLAVVEHAHRAITNCVQTLGGYGYMEDYGLEKRLRDVSTLKSLHGAPDQLKLLLNELARGGN